MMKRFWELITYRKERNALRAELNALEERLQAVEAIIAEGQMRQAEKTERRGSGWETL